MIDARSAVGTHPSGAGGGPWRDCTYYGVEIPSLVHLLLSQRNALIAMPREIDWASEKAAVTTPAFDTTYRRIPATIPTSDSSPRFEDIIMIGTPRVPMLRMS